MSLDEIFGEPISVYTEDQAIEDGSLIHPYPTRWPWLLITPGVHSACSQGDCGRNYDQCLIPLLNDCIMAARKAMKQNREFATLEFTVAGEVLIVPNGKGGATVMQPHER